MKLLKMTKIFILTLSLITFVICVTYIGSFHDAYQTIWILPFTFLIMVSLLFILVNKTRSGVFITIWFFTGLNFIRYVISPLLGTITGYYSTLGSYIMESSAQKTIVLLAWEMVVCTMFLVVITRIYGHEAEITTKDKRLSLKGSSIMYIVFILIAVILYITIGQNTFHFLIINSGIERSYSLTNNSPLISSIITYGLNFFVIIYIYLFYIKYEKNKKNRFVIYALIVVMFRLTLFSSEGRMSVVYLTIAYLWLLPMLFPEYKKFIYKSIGVIALIVIGLISIYKTLNVFLYDSYALALSNSDFKLLDLSGQLDIYVYGIKTVSRNISFADINNISILNFIFDIFRNTFGLHYLFRDSGMITTSEIYNMYIYSGVQASGHLLSGISYGYLYFGFILAPVVVCFNIFVAAYFERWIKTQIYIERVFIASTIYARFALQLFSYFAFNWNIASRTIVIGIIIIEGASVLKNRRYLSISTKNS